LLILLGVLLAVTGGLVAMVVASGGGGSTANNAVPTATPEPAVQVVFAAKDIHVGDRITADMLETRSLPLSAAAALGGDTFSDPNRVINKIAGENIQAGQALLAGSSLMTVGQVEEGTDISAEISQGMVAVSMEVDQVNGVGTLIVPQDHIDIVLSVYVGALAVDAKDPAGNQISLKGGTDVTTKMVIQNRKVLRTLLPPPTAVATPVGSGAPVAKATTGVVQNTGRHMIIIVEVKPEEAEVINWAQREEKTDSLNYIDLFVALRSSQDDSTPDVTTNGVTFKVLVDKWGVLPIDPRAILPAAMFPTAIQW
jgi:Flp pilus assembly protein CpaB